MKKKNFILIFSLGLAITLITAFSISLTTAEKKSSDETMDFSSEYFNDLNERTGQLGESIIKNLDGTKFRLHSIIGHAEKFPTQIIHLEPIKEITSKEKQNIKNKIHNIIKSNNFSDKETFEIVFEEKSIKN